MAFMQMYRPMRGRGQRNGQDLLNANVPLSSGYGNSLIPQANLCGATMSNTTTSPYAISNYPFILEIPAGIFMDEYWDLAIDGSLLPNAAGVVAPSAAFVSPQYMGGGERVVVPQFNIAAGLPANYDQGPMAATTGATVTAFSGSTVINARRVGVFASENPAELPPVFNWQYRRTTKRYPIGNASKVDIPITEYGQVLSTFVTIFDPALGTTTSAVITTSRTFPRHNFSTDRTSPGSMTTFPRCKTAGLSSTDSCHRKGPLRLISPQRDSTTISRMRERSTRLRIRTRTITSK
jgi:hypothetical protein